MTEAIAVPHSEPATPNWRFLGVVPGVILLAVVGYGGKFLEQFFAT